MKRINKISFAELPFAELKKIGLTKDYLMNVMDKKALEALLKEKRTPVLKGLKIQDRNGVIRNFDAKLSLQEKQGNLVLHIHPKLQEIDNSLNLKIEDLGLLKKGEILTRSIEGEQHLLQLDKDTNEILRVKQKNINLPIRVEGVNLTQEQKTELKKGNSIQLTKGDKEFSVKINLNNDKGLEMKGSFDQKQKEKYDFEHPEFKGILKTDRNEAEFLKSQKTSLKM